MSSPTRVLGAASAFLDAFTRITENRTIEAQQIQLLLVLYTNGSVVQGNLEKLTGVGPSSISRNIAKLGAGVRPATEKGPGWVQSYDDPNNRRTKIVELTPAGRKMLEKVSSEVAHLF